MHITIGFSSVSSHDIADYLWIHLLRPHLIHSIASVILLHFHEQLNIQDRISAGCLDC